MSAGCRATSNPATLARPEPGRASVAGTRTAVVLPAPFIAEAAQIGRSTLHRYFSDRKDLMNAAVVDSFRVVEESTAGAAIDQGPPLEAMRRLIAALVDAGDRLAFLFGDPRVLEEFTACFEPDLSVPTTVGLIERGQAEGVFDAGVSAEWIQQVLWALTYTGWEAAEKGLLPRHGVAAAVTRAFESGMVVSPARP
ncbi:TetR/AcrR family transcriptional regulator [Microbispora hainanensis]|uniref:TetR/AcrR family transcriptional regulator n=1 Tax=Microbispora hainanensis TaxID=568844 RepID=UPI001FCB7D3E|nr:TetR/AcrR family transcriptional regulator [Microbispora hainanensis]